LKRIVVLALSWPATTHSACIKQQTDDGALKKLLAINSSAEKSIMKDKLGEFFSPAAQPGTSAKPSATVLYRPLAKINIHRQRQC